MSCETVIQVEQLSKCYRRYADPGTRLRYRLQRWRQRWLGGPAPRGGEDFHALSSVSFSVQRGETVGIIGRNGSGKSTLLQLVCGTLFPSSGAVSVHGRVVALLELGSGFNPEFSGRDNVYLNASMHGLSREQIDSRFEAIVTFAAIGDFIEQPVKCYSSGMLVRLAFAVIAHVDADILVIDEALAVGDVFFTQKCMRYLRQFARQGTLLFVSHDTSAVKALCNRVLWLDRGELKLSGNAKSVCEAYLEAEFADTQSTLPRVGIAREDEPEATPARDQRDAFINASNLRNDIRVFAFDPDARALGKQGASIVHVGLYDPLGHPLSWIVGGETVVLRIRVRCHQPLRSPVVGFMVKDRVGQPLFGDNTYLSDLQAPTPSQADDVLQAEFMFDMPRLPMGHYAVIVAVADGDQEHNVQHHWIHDALQFRSECSSVTSGLVGLPMRNIQLRRTTDIRACAAPLA